MSFEGCLLQAGIASENNPDQLLVALEPEAASIYVRRLRMHQLVPEKPVSRPLTPRKAVDEIEHLFNLDRVGDPIRDGKDLALSTFFGQCV